MEPTPERRPVDPLPWALFALLGLIFLPVIRWLTAQTLQQAQLAHAFVVMVAATGYLLWTRREGLSWQGQMIPAAWNRLALALALVVVAYGAGLWGQGTLLALSFLGGFICLLYAFGLFAFGQRADRALKAVLGAFLVFTALALLMPHFDWPLRALSGQSSAALLSALGHEVQLGLHQERGQPILLLISNGQPFNVAAECNGFGVMTASLLLAILLVVYRQLRPTDKLLLPVVAGLLAFVGNQLRIVIIVMLAPVVGSDHYFLMHEIVGTATYYATLLGVWWLVAGHPKSPARRSAATPEQLDASPTAEARPS